MIAIERGVFRRGLPCVRHSLFLLESNVITRDMTIRVRFRCAQTTLLVLTIDTL